MSGKLSFKDKQHSLFMVAVLAMSATGNLAEALLLPPDPLAVSSSWNCRSAADNDWLCRARVKQDTSILSEAVASQYQNSTVYELADSDLTDYAYPVDSSGQSPTVTAVADRAFLLELLNAPPNSYVLQWRAANQRAPLEELRRRYPVLQDATIVQYQRAGSSEFVLLDGPYPSRVAALTALKKTPRVAIADALYPWTRSIASIQRLIKPGYVVASRDNDPMALPALPPQQTAAVYKQARHIPSHWSGKVVPALPSAPYTTPPSRSPVAREYQRAYQPSLAYAPPGSQSIAPPRTAVATAQRSLPFGLSGQGRMLNDPSYGVSSTQPLSAPAYSVGYPNAAGYAGSHYPNLAPPAASSAYSSSHQRPLLNSNYRDAWVDQANQYYAIPTIPATQTPVVAKPMLSERDRLPQRTQLPSSYNGYSPQQGYSQQPTAYSNDSNRLGVYHQDQQQRPQVNKRDDTSHNAVYSNGATYSQRDNVNVSVLSRLEQSSGNVVIQWLTASNRALLERVRRRNPALQYARIIEYRKPVGGDGFMLVDGPFNSRAQAKAALLRPPLSRLTAKLYPRIRPIAGLRKQVMADSKAVVKRLPVGGEAQPLPAIIGGPDDSYTIQWFAANKPDAVERMKQRFPELSDAVTVHFRRNQKDWYVLLQGQYDNSRDALSAIKSPTMQQAARLLHPWTRPVASLKHLNVQEQS